MCKGYFGEDFKLGRDAFYNLLSESRLMVRIRRRHTNTTDSNHNFHLYPNLIKGFTPSGPNKLWVSDITYIPLAVKFCYLSLVTDAYSHKIMGWVLAPTLAYRYTEEALRMAIDNANSNLEGMIHHSDRGFQYAYPSYISLLESNGIKPSMTEKGDPLENAIAERVNGILKQEWLNAYNFETIDDVRTVLEKIIYYYNNKRPHASIDMLTPEAAYKMSGTLLKRWKNYYSKKVVQVKQNTNFAIMEGVILNMQASSNICKTSME
jgi:transposase InsO family protein